MDRQTREIPRRRAGLYLYAAGFGLVLAVVGLLFFAGGRYDPSTAKGDSPSERGATQAPGPTRQ